MQPVVINEMKSRAEIISQEHYQPFHNYLCDLLRTLDKEAEILLKQSNFSDSLVQKKLIFGNTYSSVNISTHRTLYYFLEYTFFEDVEDNFGNRDNDVGIEFGIDYYIDETIRILRHIQSDIEEVAYQPLENLSLFSSDLFDEIDKMKVDFLKVLSVFINERA